LQFAELGLELVGLFHGRHGLVLLLLEEILGGGVLGGDFAELLAKGLEGGLEARLVQILDLLEVRLVFLVAVLERRGIARFLGLFLDELGQGVIVPCFLVLLAVGREGRAEVLDGREALDAVGLAELLGFVDGAVNVGDDGIALVVVLFSEAVPIGFQLLAVASPWCLELDQDELALGHALRHLLVPGRLDDGQRLPTRSARQQDGGRGREREKTTTQHHRGGEGEAKHTTGRDRGKTP